MRRLQVLRIMSNYWLLMVISCFGSVHLQYINTGGPAADSVLNPLDSPLYYPLPYNNYYHPPTNNFEEEVTGPEIPNAYYNGPGLSSEDIEQTPSTRDRRTTKVEETVAENNDTTKEASKDSKDATLRREVPAKRTVFLQELAEILNNAEVNPMLRMQKKNFSPWGGKRRDASLGTNIEHAYMWKRPERNHDTNMPKRVRFSPWGGKRNGQVVYKQGPKNSRIIFSTTVPLRIMTNYLPYEGLNLAGFHVIPMLDKRQPIKILAIGSHDTDVLPEGLPFKSFLQVIPKMFKPGRPFADVNMKKDGKRKVKFSAWGGKRSPPIIGPIWTPASNDVKDATLNALVLIRNSQNFKKNEMTTF